jgi:homopolymeric O-antigen transport system ATP-binding protein
VSTAALRTEHLGKRYRTGTMRAPYGRLSESVSNAVRSAVRRSPQARVGSSLVWALRDISLEVEQGEVVGIIGRNGAGKTTLLKILAGITEPTEGRAGINGRVGSLLEVGTGFHPELTGRENILLNGAILGMRRREILRKFDDIVEFAETGAFLDTPVKRYSSGMYVRLAFAVAAHLEPEILIVDEVLAVGDAAFQKRCLGKIGDVAKAGRTVLFVSHNMTAINQLCPRTVLLSDGKLAEDGPTMSVIAAYLRSTSEHAAERTWDAQSAPGSARARLRAVRLRTANGVMNEVAIDEPLWIDIDFEMLLFGSPTLCAAIRILDTLGNIVLSTASTSRANALPDDWFGRAHEPGLYRATCEIPGNFLNDGLYHVTAYLATFGPESIEAEAREVLSLTVFDTGAMRDAGVVGPWPGVVRLQLPWCTEFLDGSQQSSAAGS